MNNFLNLDVPTNAQYCTCYYDLIIHDLISYYQVTMTMQIYISNFQNVICHLHLLSYLLLTSHHDNAYFKFEIFKMSAFRGIKVDLQ